VFICGFNVLAMREIQITDDELVLSLLKLSEQKQVCFLDSCGVSHLDSHLLIAGIEPIETLNISNTNPAQTLELFNKKLAQPDSACIFTISYDFGLKLENIKPRKKQFPAFPEPDIFIAVFDSLIIHDYNTGKTRLVGNSKKFNKIEKDLFSLDKTADYESSENSGSSKITSNFTHESYVSTVEKIQEFIKRGDTYQTNLTQQIHTELPENLNAQRIFWSLRKSHPAPFAAFIKRDSDFVVSISPERILIVQSPKSTVQSLKITTSPIKGTLPRGETEAEDLFLRNELLNSKKDRAENVMIVDLLRNDIGRICEFGSVSVEKLCDLETHPTLFHLVSTVSGKLIKDVDFADIIKAVFPCGSITGAPKIRTMQIIDELETAERGLSMGAIGYSVMENGKWKMENKIDMNVAIRTMVIRGREAIFNVGGGIVIDSNAEDEYAESLLKAKALLQALGASFE
jgi:para-aminobenzoate synthetase component 1